MNPSYCNISGKIECLRRRFGVASVAAIAGFDILCDRDSRRREARLRGDR
jgi:hypothetical protein